MCNESQIEIDTLETNIPLSCCEIPKYIDNHGNFIGLIYKIYQESIYLKISGKLFATPNEYGAVTIHNYGNITDKIYELTGIEIDQDYLIYMAPLFSVHVKIDVLVEDNPSDYLSVLRELFKRNTRRFDVYKYYDLKYENGLQVISKPNTPINLTGLTIVPKAKRNDRLCAYIKGIELQKPDNKEYIKNFDYEFLEESLQHIRFEYQMRRFEDMRGAFNIPYVDNPTIFNILHSTENPVYKVFMHLIEVSEQEVIDEDI